MREMFWADFNSASARYQDLNGKRLARLQFIRSVVHYRSSLRLITLTLIHKIVSFKIMNFQNSIKLWPYWPKWDVYNWSACIKRYVYEFVKVIFEKTLTAFWRFNRFSFLILGEVLSIYWGCNAFLLQLWEKCFRRILIHRLHDFTRS